MGIELEIDKLVVRGVSAADSERLAAIVERELRSLAAARRGGGSAVGREISDLVVEIPAGLGVGDIGKRVAQSIWSTCQGASGVARTPGPPLSPDDVTPGSPSQDSQERNDD